jgi:hypothetical protein
MDSFPYTNPYTQPTRQSSRAPESVEDLLQQLETASHQNLAGFLKQSWTHSLSSFEWNLSTSIRLVDWVLNFVGEKKKEKNPGLLTTILHLLAKCFETWDDRLVYAAAVHQHDEDTSNQTLLSILESMSLLQRNRPHEFDSLRAAALSVLTSAWESLDRLHQITSCLPVESRDTAWWIPSTEHKNEWQETVTFVLQTMKNRETNESTTSSQDIGVLRPEEWKATCASFLVQLLQHEQIDWIYYCTEPALDELTQALSTEASRLIDPNMPVSSYTKLSLMSMQLWISLCQARGLYSDDDKQQRTGSIQDLIDPVIHASFAGAGSQAQLHGYRWTQVQHTSLPISKWSQGVLHALCRSSLRSLKDIVAIHPLVRQRAEEGWLALLKPQDQARVSDSTLHHLFLLYRGFEAPVRDCLRKALEVQSQTTNTTESCGMIPVNLLQLIRKQDSVWAAGLLVALLSDRRKRVRHDGISRAIWKSIDSKFVAQCMEPLVSRQLQSVASDYHGSKMICLLDSVLVMLTMDESLRHSAVTSLSAEAVESLVNIMSPKQIRMEAMGASASIVEYEEDTPPAHNLSRMEETSIFIDEDQLPRGMDSIIRLSAASTLATLSGHLDFETGSDEGHIYVLQQRMTEAVGSFVSQIKPTTTTAFGGNSSLEMTRRRLRLLTALSDPENEEYLSLSLHSLESSQRKAAEGCFLKLNRCSQELKESRQRERQLQADKENSDRRLVQQALRFQRENIDLQRRLAIDSKKQVEVHWVERSKAEKLARDLSTRFQDAERRMDEAEQVLKACRTSEEHARSSLEQYAKKVAELEPRERDLSKRVKASENELKEVAEELESTTTAYKKASACERDLRERLNHQEYSLGAAEESESAMRDSLESLFADMVSLAQLYEIKEQEISSAKENGVSEVEDLKRKLKARQRQNTELEEQLQQVKYENDVLSNKCAKAREKLERERIERQRDVEQRKRTGPVSYINQLHQSTVSERSSKSSRPRQDKENESSRSTTGSERSSRSTRPKQDKETESFRSTTLNERSSKSSRPRQDKETESYRSTTANERSSKSSRPRQDKETESYRSTSSSCRNRGSFR